MPRRPSPLTVTTAWSGISRRGADWVVDRLLYSRSTSSPGVRITLERAEAHLARGRRDLATRGLRRAAILFAAVRRLGWTDASLAAHLASLARSLGATLIE